MSRPDHKCPGCSRRVKRTPYIALADRKTRRETRYHGDNCSGLGLGFAERSGPVGVVLRLAHPRSCGDPAGRMSCRGESYKVGDSVKA